MDLFVTLFLRGLAEVFFPTKKETPPDGGTSIFIPFEDGRTNQDGQQGQEQVQETDQYFPDIDTFGEY